MISFIHHGQPIKLSKYIQKNYPQIGYAAFCALIRKKDIKLNGTRIKVDTTINEGDKVEVYFDQGKVKEWDLSVVFEDDNLLVVDKPQGLLSVSEGSELSAYSILLKRYPSLIPFHRLDKNTGGLLIFVKNDTALACLKQASKNQQIKKTYTALVYGCVKNDSAVLQGYLKKDSKNSVVEVAKKPFEGAQKIVTEYRVLNRNEDTTLLEVCIASGKTHQIRAHLASIGHFILGDTKYGNRELSKNVGVQGRRQQLQATSISFLNIDAPLSYLSNTIINV